MHGLLSSLLVGMAAACDPKHLAAMPDLMTLHAPYTPFANDSLRSLNASAETVSLLAQQAKAFGVNTVWAPGGMGQFETLSVTERKTLMKHWIDAGKANGLYIIAHVGTTSMGEAIELAEYAASAGADAIASVPGYYEPFTTAEAVAEFLQPIAAAAPQLPFFYYHIPEATHAAINAFDLLQAAANKSSPSTEIPTLCGIKYVSTDLRDWFLSVEAFNDTKALLFAPEPKLASFSLGAGRGVVLAEDFYAPTFLRMYKAWLRGDTKTAASEQAWKFKADAIFSTFGGGKRLLYEHFPITGGHVAMGPARLPRTCLDPSMKADLFHALDSQADFWKKTTL